MHSTMRSVLQDSHALEGLTQDEVLMLFAFLSPDTRESFAESLNEKVHDGKCSIDRAGELLKRFEVIQTRLHTAIANYTNTVNQAYDASFFDLLATECATQEATLNSLEQEYQSFLVR